MSCLKAENEPCDEQCCLKTKVADELTLLMVLMLCVPPPLLFFFSPVLDAYPCPMPLATLNNKLHID